MELIEDRTERIAKRIVAMSHFGSYGGFDFYIKSQDLYEEAHVHAEKEGKEVKFWLEPRIEYFNPKKKRCPFTRSEFNNCEEIVESHRIEFLNKFRNEQKKNGIAPKLIRKNTNTKKSNAETITAYAIDRTTLINLPVAGEILKKINNNWIKNVICDRQSCIVTFVPNKANLKPWLEICFFKDKQHIDFEIVTASEGDKKFLDYEVFVTPQNEKTVVRKILAELLKVYLK